MHVIQLINRLDLDDHFFIDNEVTIETPTSIFLIDDLEFFFFNNLSIVQLQVPTHRFSINLLKQTAPDGIMDSKSRCQISFVSSW